MSRFPTDRGPEAFLVAYEARVRPLRRTHGETYWRFAIGHGGGLQSRLEELENQLSALHADPAAYEALARWSAEEHPPLVARQVQLLLPEFRQNQVDEALRARIIRLGLEVEDAYGKHRPVVDGEVMSSNQLDRELLKGRDDRRRRLVWEATRDIGREVRDTVIELVEARNELARELGFSDYFALELANQEMDPDALFGLLDQLREATDAPWARQKAALDREVARERGKAASELMPWDYPDRFLQSVPRHDVGRSTDLFFTLRAIKKNTRGFYRSIGLPIDDLWTVADLLPRDGKSPHAFCIGIDNPSDVRVLCNLDATSRWMETSLHEFGHAVYNAGISEDLPWVLREAAHTFITEAVAMFFGRLPKTRPWLENVAGVPASIAAHAQAALAEAQLVFARWVLVVTNFERELYRDPRQDLESRWWELVEDIQGLRRPDGWDAPDWASKIHLACYPVYYQNYLLGELLASQFRAAIARRTGQEEAEATYAGRPEVGAFFAGLFSDGQKQRWDDAVRSHTGWPLQPDHWVRQFAPPGA